MSQDKSPEAQVLNLADLVDYQEAAVVSRALISKPTGIITLFAFDKEQALSEHTTPFDALVHVVDGEAEVIISGKPSILKKDQIIIMPANQPHSLRAVEKFKMVLVMIKS
jgi:quercetin dioxygenase-like cupin family protein